MERTRQTDQSSFGEQGESCRFCETGTVVLDISSDELVCSACGCVANTESRRANFDSELRAVLRYPITRPPAGERGLSTLIGLDDTDARGRALDPAQKVAMQRLRTWNNRSMVNDSMSRNLDKALRFLNNFGSKLYLSRAVMQSAAYIYRKAAARKLAKGRSTLGLVGASLYAACRENAAPKTIADVAATCNLTNKDLMSHYKLLLQELSLKMPVPQGGDYVTLVANRLDLSEKTKREALRIFENVQRNRIALGKNPRALAGAVIYVASQATGESLRQVEICQVADISTVSLRKRCKEIKASLQI